MPSDTDTSDYEDDSDDDFNVIWIALPGVDDDPLKNIHGNQLKMTRQEMAAIFAPTFEEITDLVIEQIESAETRSKKSVSVSPEFLLVQYRIISRIIKMELSVIGTT